MSVYKFENYQETYQGYNCGLQAKLTLDLFTYITGLFFLIHPLFLILDFERTDHLNPEKRFGRTEVIFLQHWVDSVHSLLNYDHAVPDKI